MKILIHFPQAMRMTLAAKIDSPETVSLETLKEKIYRAFSKHYGWTFPNRLGTEKTIQNIALFSKETAILTDRDLQEHLRHSAHFQALYHQGELS